MIDVTGLGARSKLTELATEMSREDFEKHGADVIRRVRGRRGGNSSCPARSASGDATSRSFFIKFGNRALLSKNRARSSSLDPKVQTGPLAFPVHTHMFRHSVKISLRTAQVRHAWEGDPAA
jgi:hypothetical protein